MPFTSLEAQRSTILGYTQKHDDTGFFLQEAIRFLAVGGSLRSPGMNLSHTATVDERYLTHPLLRTLLENYFTIIWIYDDPSAITARYDMVIGKFAADYTKMWNEFTTHAPFGPFLAGPGSTLHPATSLKVAIGTCPDVRAMLNACTRSTGTRLTDLYALYRITSFDVHGKSLATIIEKAFSSSPVNFPILDVGTALDQIATDYDNLLALLVRQGRI